MNSAALSLISLCRKAGKLKLGFDAVEQSLPDAKLLLFCSDVSPKTKERMLYFANNQNTRVLDAPFTSEELHLVVGKRAVVFSITDTGLAKAVSDKLLPSAR